MIEWPFAGRDENLEAIKAAASDGKVTAVVVGGGVGIGKTRLAREVVARLAAEGWHVAWVAATRSLAMIPFGAVADLLPEGPMPSGGQVELLRSIAAQVAEWGKGQRVIIGVDDAHLLDTASAAVVGHLASRRLAFLVLTVREGQAPPDAITALTRDGHAVMLDVPGLPAEAVDRLIDHTVAGAVEGASRHRLQRIAAGNPLVLGEVLRSAMASKALRQRYGVWRLEGAVGSSGRIVEVVTEMLHGLDAGTRLVLELVACGEPFGLTQLERLAGVASVAAAEECGLVVVERDGNRMQVRLAHPLYGESVRAMMPASRLRDRYQRLAGAALAGPLRRREDALRAALWQVEGGVVTRPDVVAAGARQAVGWSGLELAERLALAARNAAPGREADQLLAQILIYRGRGDAAAAVLPPPADDGDQAAAAVTNAELLYWSDGDAEAAERTLETAATGPEGELAEGLRSWILLFDGRCGQAMATAQEVLTRPGVGPQAAIWAAAAGTAAAGYLGREIESAAIYEQGMAVAEAVRGQVPWGVAEVGYGRCLALLAIGDLARAGEFAEEGYRSTVGGNVPLMAAGWAWLRGLAELASGRPGPADASLREAVAAFDDNDTFRIMRCCLAGSAAAAALTGDTAKAKLWLERADERAGPAPRLFEPQVGRWRAWVLAAEGAISQATEAARDAAARAEGIPSEEALAWYEVARLGQPTDQRRLGELAAALDTPFAAGLTRAATELVVDERDGGALTQAAQVLEPLGQDLLAAELRSAAAMAYRRAGLRSQAGLQAAQAAVLKGRCPDAHTALLQGLSFEGLTPRERELLLLAATNSSKHIAQRLGLSVRTVDNALARAYRKLGLNGRTDLRALLAIQTIQSTTSDQVEPQGNGTAPLAARYEVRK